MPDNQLIKREGLEAEVERSMRLWYQMREERDEANTQISELNQQLIEARAETAILRGSHLDLEQKYERLLVDFTKMRTLLSTIGSHGDHLSLTVSEILAMAGATSEPDTHEEAPTAPPQERDSLQISAEEAESIADLARRLGPDLSPGALKEVPKWLDSNLQSPKPSTSIPPNGNSKVNPTISKYGPKPKGS